MRALQISLLILIISSCNTEPQAIKFGTDACDFCKMTIMDERFPAECISTKGKICKFDDAHCLISFLHLGGVWSNEIKEIYFSDYGKKSGWIKAEQAFLLKSELLRSPMGGNTAAFTTENERAEINKQFSGQLLTWNELKQIR